MPEASGKPLYVLHGRDDLLRLRSCRRLTDALVGQSDRDLAVARFDGSAELASVLDELRTPPLLAPYRVVIVDQADGFVSAHAEGLAKYLARPASTGSLVLIVESWKASSDLGKVASRVGELIDCSAPPESQIPRWIAQEASRRGKKIDPAAAGLLAAWVGSELGQLDSELEKLSLYVAGREKITAEDVGAVVAVGVRETRYALVNAIESRRVGTALKELMAMLTARGQEFRVLGMLAWHLRRGMGGAGGRQGTRVAKAQVDAWGFRSVLAADLALKTGADTLTTMQTLVTKLCL